MQMALEGVRVLDFTQMMLGPWGTQFLGDMGADVIKVERPKVGEWERGLAAMGQLLNGTSPFFLAMNRNKKSVTVDLKDPRGKEIIYALAKTADIVAENFRPGVLDRLGLGYDDLRKINPGIVYVTGSGYGPDGPYVSRPGQDLLIQSISGLAAQSGRGGDLPTPLACSVVDASTALMLALSAMVGYIHKLRSGQGQRVDVSLFNTAIALQCQELAAFMNMDLHWERSRAGVGAPWLSAPFGIYETQDGYLAIAMASLSVLAEVLDLPALRDFDTPKLAYERRDEIKPMIQEVVRHQPTAYWLEKLLARDVWCAEVQDFDDLLRDPQVAHNELIQTIQHPEAGEIRVVGVPVRFSETPGSIRLAPPRVGEHTDEVLAELGYSPAQLDALRAEGVI